MKKTEGIKDSFFSLSKSSTDGNHLYSILLDARQATISESMFDIAEKLVQNEKDNAKNALDNLWALKKNMQGREDLSTIDLLIKSYQDKMDVLRGKEEYIKKIATDSRSLLEEKRKRDAEIASVKQQLGDCSKQIGDLNATLERLNVKEQELTLIETQVKKELSLNENEVVNGLYEIIMSYDAMAQSEDSVPAAQETVSQAVPAKSKENEINFDDIEVVTRPVPRSEKPLNISELSMPETISEIHDTVDESSEIARQLYIAAEQAEKPPYPKSVVKTTSGRVIGEYYYDSKVYKNKRNYVFNSTFFCEQLEIGISMLKENFDQAMYAELLQMIQDGYKRVSENPNIHFEISTNEILNDKTLRELWAQAKAKSFNDITQFSSRLRSKIKGMGSNYMVMLVEQIGRYSEA